ncbi:MAG: iron-sulfur cluster assembly scaffold protein [Candidatus Bathyarchaeota archaeon]
MSSHLPTHLPTYSKKLSLSYKDTLAVLKALPEPKVHYSILADDILKDAVRDYLSRNNLPAPKGLVEKYGKTKSFLAKMQEMGYILI